MKEGVVLPWTVPRPEAAKESPDVEATETTIAPSEQPVESQPPKSEATAEAKSESPEVDGEARKLADHHRVLTMANFQKALREITPSASESLGTLSDLRKWNEQFGEGGRARKKMMWGGRFGFTRATSEGGEGKVEVGVPSG